MSEKCRPSGGSTRTPESWRYRTALRSMSSARFIHPLMRPRWCSAGCWTIFPTRRPPFDWRPRSGRGCALVVRMPGFSCSARVRPNGFARRSPRAQASRSSGLCRMYRPYLWQSAMAAVPLRTARGIQNKVLEALAAGLPAVVSPVVAAGLPPEAKPGVAIAESNDDFAEIICRWLSLPPAARRTLAESADLSALSWAQQLEPLWDILESASGRAASQRPLGRPTIPAEPALTSSASSA